MSNVIAFKSKESKPDPIVLKITTALSAYVEGDGEPRSAEMKRQMICAMLSGMSLAAEWTTMKLGGNEKLLMPAELDDKVKEVAKSFGMVQAE